MMTTRNGELENLPEQMREAKVQPIKKLGYFLEMFLNISINLILPYIDF